MGLERGVLHASRPAGFPTCRLSGLQAFLLSPLPACSPAGFRACLPEPLLAFLPRLS